MDEVSNKTAADDKDGSNEAGTTANRARAQTTNSSSADLDAQPKNIVEKSEIVAKQQGRSTVQATPGACSTPNILSSGDSANPHLLNFETDILAKQRAGASKSSSHEQDVTAKQKGRLLNLPDAAKPGAYSTPSLQGVESDILGKQRGGSAKISLSNLEHDIAAKQAGRSINMVPAKPGAYNLNSGSSDNSINPALRNIEADIAAKQRAGASYRTTTSVDVDVATKEKYKIAPMTVPPSSGTTSACIALQDLESEISAKQAKFHVDATDKKAAHIANSPTAPDVDSDDVVAKQQNEKPALRTNSTKEGIQSSETTGESSSKKAGIGTDDKGNKDKNDGQTKSGLHQSNGNDLEYGEYGLHESDDIAVAVAVEEDDTKIYLPSAIEFDPDSKPPMYRNRRFRLYICLLIAAAAVGTVGAALGIVLTASDSQPPENVPYRATLGIRENLARIVSPEQLDDYNSPYKKALDWITFADPMALTPDSPGFLNRFVLAYLYFTSSRAKPWTSDCAPSESEQYNCVYSSLRDTVDLTFVNRTSLKWFSNTTECEWAGIECDKFHQIRKIELSNVGMSGTFPEGLALLPYLQKLDLRYSELDGPLPANIANWKLLSDIRLKYNAFTGSIPDIWFESRYWTRLIIEGNQIGGTLSSNISKMEDLSEVTVTSNKLTGKLATEIGQMENLRILNLNSNQFQGSIPTTIGNIFHLTTMDISRNSLTGTIPEEISGCTELVDLFLYENLLTGPLPSRLWDMTSILYMNLGGNKLTGTISNRLSKLSFLREFEIENNQFNGSFPSRLPNTEVWTIRAYGNNFNGNISTEVCRLVEQGQIDDLEFDCATPIGADAPEIFCPDDCCTVCCNPDGENCVIKTTI